MTPVESAANTPAEPIVAVGRHAFVPDVSGALFWPAEATLFVADLHLGKGPAYARRGALLPPYDTRATLDRLGAVLARRRPRRVVCLGDSVHDAEAAAALDGADRAALAAMVGAREWIWVAGNHDPDPVPALGGRCVAELAIDGIACRHEAAPGLGGAELSGHFHPKASVRLRGRRVTRPCFLADGQRAVLPAFGAYAGGLDAFDEALFPLFPRGFAAFLLGRRAVHRVPFERLAPRPGGS